MSFYTMSRSGINNRTFNHSSGASLHIHFLTIAHHPSSRRYPHSPALNQIYYEQIPMWANDFLEVSVNVAQYHQYYQWYGYAVILIGTFYSLSLESNSKQLFFSHSSNFFARSSLPRFAEKGSKLPVAPIYQECSEGQEDVKRSYDQGIQGYFS